MIKTKIFCIMACLLVVGLLGSCKGTSPDLPPIASGITFRIVNLTPEVVPTEDLSVQIQNSESGEYYELSEYHKGDEIVLEMGCRMSSTPLPVVEDPAPWISQEEVFEADILVYRGDNLVGSISAQMETTKYNYNRVTRMISYTGFKSVEFFQPPHQKVDTELFWDLNSFKIQFK